MLMLIDGCFFVSSLSLSTLVLLLPSYIQQSLSSGKEGKPKEGRRQKQKGGGECTYIEETYTHSLRARACVHVCECVKEKEKEKERERHNQTTRIEYRRDDEVSAVCYAE